MKIIQALFFLGYFSLTTHVFAKVYVETVDANQPLSLEFPKSLVQSKTTKLRIRNLLNSKEVIIDFKDIKSEKIFLDESYIKILSEGSQGKLLPEFSLLKFGVSKVPSSPARQGLVYDQYTWRKINFSTRKDPLNEKGLIFRVGIRAENVVLLPRVSERLKARGEQEGIRKLFEYGHKALQLGKYTLAREAFEKILEREITINAEDKRVAHLGLGMAHFHVNENKKGCEKAEPFFKIADEDIKNADDVSFYKALCALRERRITDAEGLLKALVKKQHPIYSDMSRYYLGILAKNDARFDEAISSFMDIIDFSSDKKLIVLARKQLEQTQRLKADYNYETKWVYGALSLGGGYDSNVVGLPGALDPSAVNLTHQASGFWTALFNLEIVPPWGFSSFEQRIKYALLLMAYNTTDIREENDVQVHEAGLVFDFKSGGHRFGIGARYTSYFLGVLGRSGEYEALPAVDAHWSNYLGESLESPTGKFEATLRLGYVNPKQAASSPDLDRRATFYYFQTGYSHYFSGLDILGASFEFEYKPSAGIQNSYWMTSLGGFYEQQLSIAGFKFALIYDAGLKYSQFYQSTLGRKDILMRGSGAFSKSWLSWLETRLQILGMYNYSTDSTSYQYSKYQVNILVNALF